MCKSFQLAIMILAVGSSWAIAQTQHPPIQNPPVNSRYVNQGAGQQNPRQINQADQQQFRQLQQSNSRVNQGSAFRNQQSNQTRASISTNNFPPVQQVGYTQQDDTSVPTILSGKTNDQQKPASGGTTNSSAVPNNTVGSGNNPGASNTTENPANNGLQFNQAQSNPHANTNPGNAVENPQSGGFGQTTNAPSSQFAPNQPNTIESIGERVPNGHQTDNSARRINNNSVQSLLRAPGPWLEASAIGPKTIGVGKVADYEVKIVNRGNVDCTGVLVGVNFPSWVELGNAQVSNGTKQLTDGREEARIIWQIDAIPANSSQKLSLQLTPREAEMFDVAVQWTLIPINASAQIQVTEPKLDIAVSGPGEVQYGHDVSYNVTVRNPGTGAAENVTIHLPEELGGESKNLGSLAAGAESNFKIELTPRTAGPLAMTTKVTADGGLEKSDTQNIMVRRAKLDVTIAGPQRKYAGEMAVYNVTIANNGDALAKDVVMVMTVPPGTKYVSGIQNAQNIQGAGMQWSVGTIQPGNERQYKVVYQLEQAGQIKFEAGAQGANDLVAANSVTTTVDSVADLVMTVTDPKGPLPTGQDVVYQVKIKNRGTKTANNVMLQMFFSKGLEPSDADGGKSQIGPGEVTFDPIATIQPGQEKQLLVTVSASEQGIHTFRAKLTCREAESHDITEGTTRFYSPDTTHRTGGNQTQGIDFGSNLQSIQGTADGNKPPVNIPKTGSLPNSGLNTGGGFKLK